MRSRFALLFLLALTAAWLLSCGERGGVKPSSNLPVTVVDGVFEAGIFVFCWDQTDASGKLLIPYTYRLHITTVAGWDTSLVFVVSEDASSKPHWPCVDSTVGKDVIPSVYGAILNDSVYARGDTVSFEVQLPRFDTVVVTVE